MEPEEDQIRGVIGIAESAPTLIIDGWLDMSTPKSECPNLAVLRERNGARTLAMSSLQNTITDHLIGLDILERMGGYARSMHVISNRLPVRKQAQSGDVGEILATEYISQKTDFAVPVKRLRYKDDRNLAMRGDDVIAIREANGRTKVLKAEAKSRASLSGAVVEEADDALLRYSSRPNPATLAFISYVLRREGRDSEAEAVERLQETDVRLEDIEHLVFTLSGNDPTPFLMQRATVSGDFPRHFVGLVIDDHQEFIRSIFEGIHARDNRDTN